MNKNFIFFTFSFISEKKSKDTLHDETKDQFWRRIGSCSCSCLHNAMTTSNVHINEIVPQTIGTCFSCHLLPTPNSGINYLVTENGRRNCANKNQFKGRNHFCVHLWIFHNCDMIIIHLDNFSIPFYHRYKLIQIFYLASNIHLLLTLNSCTEIFFATCFESCYWETKYFCWNKTHSNQSTHIMMVEF